MELLDELVELLEDLNVGFEQYARFGYTLRWRLKFELDRESEILLIDPIVSSCRLLVLIFDFCCFFFDVCFLKDEHLALLLMQF